MSDSVDCIEAVIPMRKGVGELPDISGMSAKEIKKIISLWIDTVTLKSYGFSHYKITKTGISSDTFEILDGKIDGYPKLTVRLYGTWGSVKVDFSGNADPGEKATPVGISGCFAYKIALTSDSEPFYFEDQNGNTRIRRESSQCKDLSEFEEKIAPKCIPL